MCWNLNFARFHSYFGPNTFCNYNRSLYFLLVLNGSLKIQFGCWKIFMRSSSKTIYVVQSPGNSKIMLFTLLTPAIVALPLMAVATVPPQREAAVAVWKSRITSFKPSNFSQVVISLASTTHKGAFWQEFVLFQNWNVLCYDLNIN